MNYTGGASCNPLSINNGTSTTPTLSLTGCTGNGTVQVLLSPGSGQDVNGNTDDGAVSSTVTIDNTAPTVGVGSPTPTNGDSSSTFSFPVTYSGADTIILASGNITVNATGPSCDTPVVNNGTTLTSTVTLSNCTGNGTVGITVAANTSSDQAGNQNLASSASATATVTNSISCPTGGAEGEYVPVPGNAVYGTSDFCVMKYEAKAERDSDSVINAWGCIEGTTFCGQDDWVLANPAEASTPVAKATGKPWREISRNQAALECQSLGAGFDLITNDEWQTVARNIELQTSNWDQGIVGGVSTGNGGDNANRLNRGHADGTPINEPLAANTDDNQGCDGTGQTCNGGDWNLEKRTHNLSNGEVIWDLAGNLWEWVKDDYNNISLYGPNSYISLITSVSHTNVFSLSGGTTTTARNAKDQFGPLGDYTSMNSGDYGGLGYGYLLNNAGAIIRGGGGNDDTFSGVFSADLYNGSSFSYYNFGFRCVFRP